MSPEVRNWIIFLLADRSVCGQSRISENGGDIRSWAGSRRERGFVTTDRIWPEGDGEWTETEKGASGIVVTVSSLAVAFGLFLGSGEIVYGLEGSRFTGDASDGE